MPSPHSPRLDLARVLSWNKNYGAAVAEYRQILKRTPEKTDAQLELARVLSWAREYPQSVEAFDAVLRKDRKNYDAWIGKSRVYSYQSHWRQSLEAFNNSRRCLPQARQWGNPHRHSHALEGGEGPVRSRP